MNGGMNLYTKNGRPLQVSGDSVYSRSGTYVGRISNGKVYDPSGRYAGTIVGDRVVYRGTDSATMSSATISANRVGSASAVLPGQQSGEMSPTSRTDREPV